MTIAIGDMQSVGTAGWWHTSDASGSTPSTPTLSVVNDGDGDAVTATVSGDAGVTQQLLYKKLGASEWTAGQTRSGDGDIAQAGLDNNTTYLFICVSTSGGYYSLPSAQISVYVSDGAASPTGEFSKPLELARASLAASATFQTLVSAGDAAAALPYIHYFGLNPPAQWAASTAVALREFVYPDPSSAFIFECTTAGTTAADKPTWPTTDAETVADGTAVWTARAITSDAENTINRVARPYAIVGLGESYSATVIGVGTANEYASTGEVVLLLELDVPAANAGTIDDAALWFANQLGAIFADLRALCGLAGYLNVQSYNLLSFQHSPNSVSNTEGEYCQAIINLKW